MNRFKKISLTFILTFISLCHAFENDDTQNYDKDVKAVLIENNRYTNLEPGDKVAMISEKFIKKPYLLFALGEGKDGAFNQLPLYRTDAFDCETFVDTVLALSYAKDLSSFQEHINAIRYADGTPNFLTRNHFTNVDWNDNNRKKGYMKDITQEITVNHQPIYQKATTFINKKNWYQHLQENVIVLNVSPAEKNQKLKQLRTLGQNTVSNAYSEITYLPLTRLFDEKKHARQELFNQIPNGTIIEIVRPNWNLEEKIGTKLDISHLGFAIWKNGILYFRNASSVHHQVEDEQLENYLRKALQSPSIKGIHLEKPLVKT
jgi:hypothetical protein